MDAATSTASDYGHIGLFDVGAAWKTRVKEMVGTAVSEKDYLRIYNVAGTCNFILRRDGNYNPIKLKAAIRLTKKQAMMMKLRHGGSDEAFVRDDPTGECWGNMNIAQNQRGAVWSNRGRKFSYRGPCNALSHLLAGRPFGPTLATVSDHCKGFDLAVATATVWHFADRWHAAAKEVPVPEAEHQELPDGQVRVMTIVRDLFSGADTYGKAWARMVAQDCQTADGLRHYGIDALTGVIL